MGRYTDEQKNIAIELYKRGESIKTISTETGIPRGTIDYLVRSAGIPPRKSSKLRGKQKICPKCGRESGKDARFCWFCGESLRTQEESLIQKMESVLSLLPLLPSSSANTVTDAVRDVIAYLEKQGGGAK